ncbi:MAG: hypothetical protein HOI95_10640 [Chromatiales bacterium]|jgi:hypothetical protein|nr:hypothetical protein [Chromatiales bacterium]
MTLNRISVARRRRANAFWIWLAIVLGVSWSVAFLGFAQDFGSMANPLAVARTIAAAGAASEQTHLLMVMAPALAWAVFALVWACLLCIVGAAIRERQLLNLIARESSVGVPVA